MTQIAEPPADTTKVTSLVYVDQWLAQLAPEQVALLRDHADDTDLPRDLLDILKTCPLSPMQVRDLDGTETVAMPPDIKHSLTEPRGQRDGRLS